MRGSGVVIRSRRHMRVIVSIGVLLGAVAIASLLGTRRPDFTGAPADVSPPASPVAAAVRTTTLYCEFTNFADQTPRVGFYFVAEPDTPSTYALVFQRERDGTQAEFDAATRPRWQLDVAEQPAVLREPDDAIAINLYAFDPQRPGSTWFEAGLRSIRYLNLGGRCRLSSA